MFNLDVGSVNPDVNDVMRVTALNDGGALVVSRKDKKYTAIRVDRKGDTVRTLLKSAVLISNFIVLDQHNVFILQTDGTITNTRLTDGAVVSTCKVDVEHLQCGLSLDRDSLLLVDDIKGEVFSYHLSNQNKEVIVKGLKRPTSLSTTKDNSMFAVCETWSNKVHIYDSSGALMRSIGGKLKSDDGGLKVPNSALFLPTNTLLVADLHNHRVTEFNTDGNFLRHIVQEHDGIYQPLFLSYQDSNIWVVSEDKDRHWQLKRYQIFK